MNNALKFLLLAAGCALVVLLITVGVKTASKGKDDIDGNIGQYSKNASDYKEVDKTVYDGTVVLGTEVKRMIETYDKDDYLSIVVDTSRGVSTAYVNKCVVPALTVSTNSGIKYSGMATLQKSDSNYINDSGEFLASVHYDENNVAACIWFQQQ
ncbi:MAG: hypothetical protein K0S01_1656 [Herbinix sp.]|jgi:hypothetical protein|nr:hypothetical protein [Herbinix sp.]